MTGIIIGVLGVVVLLGAIRLGVYEYARFRRDPVRREPLTPEEAASDRFHNELAILIAVVSVTGAVLAFDASITFSSASDARQLATQQRGEVQRQQSLLASQVALGSRLSTWYQNLVIADQGFSLQAAADYNAKGTLWKDLDSEARVDQAIEQTVGKGFEPNFLPSDYTANCTPETPTSAPTATTPPSRSSVPGALTYCGSLIRQNDLSQSQTGRTLRTVKPEVEQAKAHRLGRDARWLLSIGALFALALLLLTIANLGPPHRRLHAFVPGSFVVIGAYILFILVELAP